MDSLLEFAKGPLFRFSFAVMILGLARLVVLSVINGLEAKKQGKDKKIPNAYVKKLTFGFVFPIRAFRVKPLYSLVSILFHIGLLLTPLFLFDHALLIDNSVGFSWLGLSLPKSFADYLTLLTIGMGIILLTMRIGSQASRFLSRKQDFLWPVLLLIPFTTGYFCSNLVINPDAYNFYMLIHVLSGCAIFIMIPFTKISHCVLLPLGQWITARVWKFPAEAGEQVEISLGKEGELL